MPSPSNEEMIIFHRQAAEALLNRSIQAGWRGATRMTAMALTHATLSTNYLLEAVYLTADEPKGVPDATS
jgi:hypothetical protein